MRLGKIVGVCAAATIALTSACGFAWWMAVREAPIVTDEEQDRAIKRVAWNHREVCPPGAGTEVVVGRAHLIVELRSVDGLLLKRVQDVPPGCPKEPILADSVYFSNINAALASIYQRHGIRLVRLELSDPSRRYGGPETIPTLPENRITIEGVGTVEDITRIQRGPNEVLGRVYRLQPFARPGENADAPIMVLCTGDPKNGVPRRRDCYTTFTLNGDLVVEYMFRQDQRDEREQYWNLKPSGPIEEPRGLLIMDAGVRSWIREMRQQ